MQGNNDESLGRTPMLLCHFCHKANEKIYQFGGCSINYNGIHIDAKNAFCVFNDEFLKLVDGVECYICLACFKRLLICHSFAQDMLISYKQRQRQLSNEMNLSASVNENTIRINPSDERVMIEQVLQELGFINKSDSNTLTVNDANIVPQLKSQEILRNEVKSIQNKVQKFRKILPNLNKVESPKHKKKKLPLANPRIYKCVECGCTFTNFRLMRKHKALHALKIDSQTNTNLVCQYCHIAFKEEKSLNVHCNDKHPLKKFQCVLCINREYQLKGHLLRHYTKCHNQNIVFFCGECNDLLIRKNREELNEHFSVNHNESIDLAVQSPCLTETIEDNYDVDLEMHEEFLDEFLLTAIDDNSFQFSWDELDLSLSDILSTHSIDSTEEPVTTRAYICPKCPEGNLQKIHVFSQPQNLINHIITDHQYPLPACRSIETCSRSNNCSCENAYPCPYCGKCYQDLGKLRQHLRIVHIAIKRYTCQVCDRQFTTMDHLKKHVLSQHHNDRKYSCTVCMKQFKQLSHLRQHMAIHTSGKTFQCEWCSLKFWRRIDVVRHKKKVHMDNNNI